MFECVQVGDYYVLSDFFVKEDTGTRQGDGFSAWMESEKGEQTKEQP